MTQRSKHRGVCPDGYCVQCEAIEIHRTPQSVDTLCDYLCDAYHAGHDAALAVCVACGERADGRPGLCVRCALALSLETRRAK